MSSPFSTRRGGPTPVARRRRRWLALSAAVAVVATTVVSGGASASAAGAGSSHRATPTLPPQAHGGQGINRAPIGMPPGVLKQLQNARLGKPVGATSTSSVKAPAGPVDPIDLRVLVLATTGDPNPDGIHNVPNGSWDWDLSTVTTAMDYLGVPYDVYNSVTKQLCVGGTWKLNWAVDPTATSSSCTSGNVVNWTNGVEQSRLSDGSGHAYYEGVIQTNGTLSYVDPSSGAFVSSALSSTEWSALWTFEAQFGIRTVSENTYPTADFGLTYTGEDGNPTNATWTGAGAAAFPYVNAKGTLPIGNAWTYRATANPTDTTTSVLMTDSAGDALAVLHTYTAQGNRQALALTFDSAGYLLHGQVLGYGLVSWVTKGLFLGERHAYLDPEPDDLFLDDSIWQPTTACGTRPDSPSLPTYRITGADFTALTNWMIGRGKPAISKGFRIEFPFNGVGTTAGFVQDLGLTKDTLVPAVKKYQANYAFINHTFDHQNFDSRSLNVTVANDGTTTTITAPMPTDGSLPVFWNAWGQTVIGAGIPANTTVVNVSFDGNTATLSQPTSLADGSTSNVWVGVTYDQAVSEIQQNNTVAQQLGLTTFNRANLVQPDISGLGNSNFLQAATDNGVKYLISDTSRTGDPSHYGVNEGTYNTGSYDYTQIGADPNAGSSWNELVVARYPVNLYFNVNTPANWLAEDNCLYQAGQYGHVDTYQQLLNRESNTLVGYLLQGHNRPLMFHQPNVTAYDGKHSLLGDLMDNTLAEYSSLVNVPVLSPTMDQLGQKQASRMVYNAAMASGALSASIVPGQTITVTNTGSTTVTVPVTGLNAGSTYGTEKYAGQNISYLPLSAGQSLTLPLK